MYDGGLIYLLLVRESEVGDQLAAGSVLLVGKAGVLRVQLELELGHQMVAVVQVTGVTGEPWICVQWASSDHLLPHIH